MSTIALASKVVTMWASAYTLGLASNVRRSRRAEIASDVWEHAHDPATVGVSALHTTAAMISRMLRGMPADILWRVNVEGPKMNLNIPFERITGGLLLSMIVLIMITSSINGYDTAADSFDGELRRLADLSAAADNGNAFFRFATGFGLIAAGAALFVSLRERAPLLAGIAAFGICAAGALELVASALQLTFVELAEEYVATSGSRQEQVFVTARAIAIVVGHVTTAAFMTLVMSTYVLAVLAGRENLVPRWLIGIPVISSVLIVAALIAGAAGVGGALWFVLMAGMFLSALWLLIAGLYLIFTPQPRAKTTSAPGPAPA